MFIVLFTWLYGECQRLILEHKYIHEKELAGDKTEFSGMGVLARSDVGARLGWPIMILSKSEECSCKVVGGMGLMPDVG